MLRDRMRDMARRRMDMRSRMDGRNPYGSRGGYVRSDRMGDYADYQQYDARMGDRADYRTDYARNGRDYERSGQYDGTYDYGYMNDMRGRDYARGRDYRSGDNGRDYAMDYAGGDKMSPEELKEWQKDLIREIDPQFRPMFEKAKVVQRAKEMGVKFDEYSEDEFVTTATMIATDYGKTVGMNNLDTILRMACNFLDDTDSELKGSEKLMAYHDYVVMGM